MKITKQTFITFFAVIAFYSGFSQTLSGTVKDEKGLPVPLASISLKGTKIGTTADSSGSFTFNVKPQSTLIISAIGFISDTILLKDENHLAITLKLDNTSLNNVVVKGTANQSSSASSSTIQSQIIGSNLQDFSNYQDLFTGQRVTNSINEATHAVTHTISNIPTGTLNTGSFLPQFNHKEDTKGTRYLFEKWVKGIVLDTGNNIIDNKTYVFNYDKVSKEILFSQDMKSAITINKYQVKAFELKDENGDTYIFEQVPAVNNGNFLEQLVKGDKYLLYKSIKTKFVKSDYHTDGMTESGNPYDEYVDEFHYYILVPATKEHNEVELKKKSIKSVLSADSQKVDSYFSQHNSEIVNEDFLKGLITFLNQAK